MIDRHDLKEILGWELPVLVKVVAALPEQYYQQRPHDRSRTAAELINTIVAETQFLQDFLDGKSRGLDFDGSSQLPELNSVEKSAQYLEKITAKILSDLSVATDEQMNRRVQFFHRETTVSDALFSMLTDLIHHRGQLSVYIKIAGGKVPSIYGPSGDEGFPA